MVEPPILRRFPALARFPRVAIGTFPTPVQRFELSAAHPLWVKRDDLCAAPVGGNKVRGLEWLLGDARAGGRVLTVGARGSTHALATATYARRAGAQVTVVRWNQEMNAAAARVDALVRRLARVVDARAVAAAYAIAGVLRLRPRTVWIPAGGATPVATLGHVNAALELAEQISRGEAAAPDIVVVPLGTGATSAGIALGLRISGLRARVAAVRVVPRVVGRRGRVLRLARAAAEVIERASGERVPRVQPDDVDVIHDFYAGAYGRALARLDSETSLVDAGINLDDTYSRKAFAAAAALGPRRVLLWLTFDGRILEG